MVKIFTEIFERAAVNSRFLQWVANCYYQPMVQREIRLANINQDDFLFH